MPRHVFKRAAQALKVIGTNRRDYRKFRLNDVRKIESASCTNLHHGYIHTTTAKELKSECDADHSIRGSTTRILCLERIHMRTDPIHQFGEFSRTSQTAIAFKFFENRL